MNINGLELTLECAHLHFLCCLCFCMSTLWWLLYDPDPHSLNLPDNLEELFPQTSLGMTSRYETSEQIPEPQGGFYFPLIQGPAGDNPRRNWSQLP